jgi:hypothetical protein
MGAIAFIEGERTARRILSHLGLSARAPPRGQPWRPGQQNLAINLDGVDPPVIAE